MTKEFRPTNKTIILFSLIQAIVSFAVIGLAFSILFGFETYLNGHYNFVFTPIISFPSIILGIVVHEFIHFVVLSFSKDTHFKDVKFGLNKTNLSPYVHCKVPVSKAVYRISLIAPFLALSIVPAVLGFIFEDSMFLFFGLLFSLGSGADLLMFVKLMKFSGAGMVQDLSDSTGFLYLKVE